MNRGIWIVAEQKDGEILDSSLEVVSEMKRVAACADEKISAILMGDVSEEKVNELAAHGAQNVYTVKSDLFDPYCSTIYSGQLIELIEKYRPRLVTAGATSSTRDYFPRVAAITGAGLVTNCAIIDINKKGVLLSKPMYGGMVYGKFISQSDVTMATILPGAFSKSAPDVSAHAEITGVEAIDVPESLPTKILGHIEADPETVDVSEAQLIVAGGRGMGGAENFECLEKLASLMGAAVGGSRPAVDEGWIDFERQIGQSGKTVAPQKYLAFGISGSSYHVMGIKDSEFTIAINTDKRAPIMSIADVGVVADADEIISEMIKIYSENNVEKPT